MTADVKILKVKLVTRGVTEHIYLGLQNFILAHKKLHSFHTFLYSALYRNKTDPKININEFKNAKIAKFRGFKMFLDPNEPHDHTFYMLSRQNKLYEDETSAILVNNLEKGDTFLDIGANNGYFSLLAAKLVGG